MNLRQFQGLTFFSAAVVAGLRLEPVVGQGRAMLVGRRLRYDPGHMLTTQRSEVLGRIASHLSRRGGSPILILMELERLVLPAEPVFSGQCGSSAVR